MEIYANPKRTNLTDMFISSTLVYVNTLPNRLDMYVSY